jgi:hypothetical protein
MLSQTDLVTYLYNHALGLLGLIFLLAAAVLGLKQPRKKEKLAALRGEISAALAKAEKAAITCLEMQNAVALAEAVLSTAGLDTKKAKFKDGPTEKELLEKAEQVAFKALTDLWRLSVESVQLSPISWDYVNLRTYCRLAHAVCKACDPQLCRGNCQALEILKKIKLT